MDEKTREREFRPLKMIKDTLDFSKSGIKNINAEQFLNGEIDL